MQSIARNRSQWVIVALVVALGAHTVSADGWKIQLMGGANLGTCYAGRSVLGDDASTVWFNPATMTLLPRGWTMTFGAPLITYRLDYRDAGSRSVLRQPLLGESSKNGGTTAIVPHVYLVRRLNGRSQFGFGFNAPFGLGTNYDETWVGRYHATETALTVFNLNPSLAVKVNDALAVGFGLDVQHAQATLANMIDFGSLGAAAGLPLAPQGSDGRVRFKGSDWAMGFNAGLRWQITTDDAIGAAYRSEINHDLRGPADFTVPAAAAPLTAGGRVFADTEARVRLPMPHELSVSASHRVNADWMLLGDATWTRWSAFKELTVEFDNPLQPAVHQPADWRDALRVAAGAKRSLGSHWSVRTGAAYEISPVPQATRTPRLPERNHTWLSAAGSRTTAGGWTYDIHVSHLITPDAGIDLSDAAAGTLTGNVHWRLTVLGVSATKRF
jgi:long-chain fatty acid transport protein